MPQHHDFQVFEIICDATDLSLNEHLAIVQDSRIIFQNTYDEKLLCGRVVPCYDCQKCLPGNIKSSRSARVRRVQHFPQCICFCMRVMNIAMGVAEFCKYL